MNHVWIIEQKNRYGKWKPNIGLVAKTKRGAEDLLSIGKGFELRVVKYSP